MSAAIASDQVFDYERVGIYAVFAGVSTAGSIEIGQFVQGMQGFFVIVACISLVGTLISVTRGRDEPRRGRTVEV